MGWEDTTKHIMGGYNGVYLENKMGRQDKRVCILRTIYLEDKTAWEDVMGSFWRKKRDRRMKRDIFLEQTGIGE